MLHLREHCVELWTLADLAEEFFGNGYIDAGGAVGAALRRFKKQHPELIAHCALCNSDEHCRPPGHLEPVED